MKEINKNIIEQSLLMYKENVSPSRKNLEMILSQIPEQKIENSLTNLNEIQGKAILSTEMYTSYNERESGSFDTVVRQNSKTEKARAIRSPYIWITITEMVTLCSIMFAVLPTLTNILNDPFYKIDKEVQIFEMGIEKEDYRNSLIDSSL